jgi:hypothetical protein
MNVIVVGNGACLLKNNNKELIDKQDLVIRLGAFQIKGYEQHVGEKTDVWANGVSTLKIWKLFEGIENKNLWVIEPQDTKTKSEYLQSWQNVKYTSPQFTKEEHIKKLELLVKKNKVECIQNRDLEALTEELKIHKYLHKSAFVRPSLGLCTVYMAIQKYNQIKTIGFDNMMSGWYWDLTHGYWHSKHSTLMERIWFEKAKKTGKIISYD